MEVGPRTKSEVARKLGKAKPSRHLHETMARLVASGALDHTIPEKPNSRLQRYFTGRISAQWPQRGGMM